MTTEQIHASHPFRTAPYRDDVVDFEGLTVPYAGQTRMRLTISSGMADARVRIDPDATDLIAIDYGEGTPPRLRVSPTELRLSWQESIGSWLRAAFAGQYRDIDVVLHPAVEWALHVRGGLVNFEADLTAGKLARLEIGGGVYAARLDLPAPGKVVPVRISGGTSELGISRPAEIGVVLAVAGGISGLRLDDQSFGAIGGGARLSTGPVRGDDPRYELEITGGASNLDVVGR